MRPPLSRILLFLFFLCLSLQVQGRGKDLKTTIVVSLDAMRWDYPIIYSTPNLDRIAREGVQSDMRSVYPASTFPSHWAMATGLVPDHNGIVNTAFWDPETGEQYSKKAAGVRDNPHYFLGEPIWQAANRQGVRTATIYWVGSDVAVNGMHPDDWEDYAKPLLSYQQRIDKALGYLKMPKDERPGLIMMYFDEPDASGHTYGPYHEKIAQAVLEVDAVVGQLLDGIKALGMSGKVNLIVVSDHGMASISPERNINPRDYLKEEWMEHFVSGLPVSITSREGFRDSIYLALKDIPQLQVWKTEEMPQELQYGTSQREGDIIVAPRISWQFSPAPSTGGNHGYSPYDPEMMCIFRATGPDFKKGYIARQFHNVDLYPLLCHLLGIQGLEVDGKFERISHVLR